MFFDEDASSPEAVARRRETADYIGSLVGELATLAAAHRLTTLRYLLEMARQEAFEVASLLPEAAPGASGGD
ncbi:hypothetical protein [Ancylobacter terrae]|uniref:hypothetical protein n=1 Tax=Ancylobacter sp. sgz301288 TaxID=3342077 RepID=UPI00385F94FD